MVVQVHITTYNRPEMLARLLGQLSEQSQDRDGRLDIHIWDDASTYDVQSRIFEVLRDHHLNICLYLLQENRGKERYWKTMHSIFQKARQKKWDYFLMLQDDLELCSGFFDRISDTWNTIGRRYSVINLFTDETRVGRSIWGCPTPKLIEDTELWQCNWTDPMFFCDRWALDAIGFYMKPIENHSPAMGSKVGMQLSKRFNAAGVSIYQGIETLVHHGDHPSMMNPELRKQKPLTA